MLAKLHTIQLIQPFLRKNPWGLRLITRVQTYLSDNPCFYPEISGVFSRFLPFILPFFTAKLPISLIHGDVFPDNTVFKGNILTGMLDLEAACTEVSLYDIGVALNGFAFLGNVLQSYLLQSFLNSYETIRKLIPAEKELIFLSIQAGCLTMVAYHLNSLIHKRRQKNVDRALYLTERLVLLGNIDPNLYIPV